MELSSYCSKVNSGSREVGQVVLGAEHAQSDRRPAFFDEVKVRLVVARADIVDEVSNEVRFVIREVEDVSAGILDDVEC